MGKNKLTCSIRERVPSLATYLASDKAAFLTGANIAIDGGQHMF
jgi:acetoacetyl-CoA reductase